MWGIITDIIFFRFVSILGIKYLYQTTTGLCDDTRHYRYIKNTKTWVEYGRLTVGHPFPAINFNFVYIGYMVHTHRLGIIIVQCYISAKFVDLFS